MKGELISTVIVVVIVIGSAILAMNIINPLLREGRETQSFNEAKKTLETIDAAVSQVFFEAPGARRSIDVDVREGKVIVSGGENRIKIRLDDVDLFAPGLRKKEGNILVTSGAQLNSYEGDVDSDSNIDLILENDYVLFAVRKLGNKTNHVVVNTSDIISLIRNKRTSTDVPYPRSGIFINDTYETSYGIGYTELTQTSGSITTAGIKIYMNATDANTTYTALFTLGSAQDFVDLEVQHIKGFE